MSSVVEQNGTGRMARQAGVVGFFTLLSRFFGLARVSAIAYLLGTTAAADAFYVAFRIPNLFRRMLAEGNLTISFVPVFTEALHRSREEAKQVVDVTATLLFFLLLFLTCLGVLGAPLLVRVVAWGFDPASAKFALTAQLTRITFPFLFFISFAALMMGILNARKYFAAPAAAPIFLNVGIILGALALTPLVGNPAVALAWGVLLGGLLQVLIQLPQVIRQGFFPRANFNFRLPAIKEIARLMGPTMYGSAVYQVNLLLMTLLASLLPTGSVSYLEYANRVMELPIGVFAVSLATVSLPKFSDHGAMADHVALSKSLRRVLSMAAILTIPAAVGLAVLAEPILTLLFLRGDFNLESALNTASALKLSALGLPFIAAARITIGAFYAVQEARKPVRAANLSVLVTILTGIVLLKPLGFRALALAVSLGGLSNLIFLLYYYRQKIGGLGLASLLGNLLKITGAALGMGFILWIVKAHWDLSFSHFWLRTLYTFSMIGLGGACYLIMIFVLKVDGLDQVWQMLRRRFSFAKR